MTSRALGLACVLSLAIGCRERRVDGEREPVSYATVEPILLRACATCHGADRALGGYRVTPYYEALGCVAQRPVVRPQDGSAPLNAALDRIDHAGLLTPAERALLITWLEAGTPDRAKTVHGPDILDPRSAGWHGTLAAEDGWAALRDAKADAVCGRCHEGAPVRPDGVRFGAPGAPACSSCHAQAGGVLACATCHGDDARAYPPRDGCYFDAGMSAGAHAAHLSGTRFRSSVLACASCHPTPSASVFEATHADGRVDVAFATPFARVDDGVARFDPESGRCSVGCHTRGGESETPSFRSALALDCNSCHRSPPLDHYPGPCSRCHAEMGESASSLHAGPLHLNGSVDVGLGGNVGFGACGSCHGQGDDPRPRDHLHERHLQSVMTTPISCDSCHVVPSALHAPGHLDGVVQVRFAARALREGTSPSYEPAQQSCRDTACHAGALRTPREAPSWRALPAERDRCSTCHALPPPLPHVQDAPACGSALCHGAEVSGALPTLGISEVGRALHLDSHLQAGR